ncbi:MAG: lipoyl(octanoyl) transferase LipB [Dehalococcoidia bacterium]|nr:lipoyl(octanoyl) transferase LipB [Dehalococcoidia bacterium]
MSTVGIEQMPRALLGRLGLIPYDQAMVLEEELRQLRYEGSLPDAVLIMEHPPTVTLGRFGSPDHILLPLAELARQGIAFAHSKRGGDATFHAPGQLVLHAVMDLRRREGILRGFVTDLEEVALRLLADYGIMAERWSEHPGLWVGGQQIGAIGLHLSHGISAHGLAINVDPDLTSFGVINLCGLPGQEATSIARELGHHVHVKQAICRLAEAFAGVFRVRLTPVSRAYLNGCVAEATV